MSISEGGYYNYERRVVNKKSNQHRFNSFENAFLYIPWYAPPPNIQGDLNFLWPYLTKDLIFFTYFGGSYTFGGSSAIQ